MTGRFALRHRSIGESLVIESDDNLRTSQPVSRREDEPPIARLLDVGTYCRERAGRCRGRGQDAAHLPSPSRIPSARLASHHAAEYGGPGMSGSGTATGRQGGGRRPPPSRPSPRPRRPRQRGPPRVTAPTMAAGTTTTTRSTEGRLMLSSTAFLLLFCYSTGDHRQDWGLRDGLGTRPELLLRTREHRLDGSRPTLNPQVPGSSPGGRTKPLHTKLQMRR